MYAQSRTKLSSAFGIIFAGISEKLKTYDMPGALCR